MASTIKQFSRLGNISFYADIARDSFSRTDDLLHNIKILEGKIALEHDKTEKMVLRHDTVLLEQELSKLAINVIVYSAMALEAYIYDYSSRELGKSFVEKHLDKLDILSKYIVATQLITQKKFPKDQEVFYRLDKLIKFRNKLVHSKSTKFDPENEELLERLNNVHVNQLDGAKNAIKAMNLVAEYIESTDSEEPASFLLALNREK